MNKLIAIAPIFTRGPRQAAKAPEGSVASGKALGGSVQSLSQCAGETGKE